MDKNVVIRLSMNNGRYLKIIEIYSDNTFIYDNKEGKTNILDDNIIYTYSQT